MTDIAKLDQYGLLLAAGGDARAFLHAQLTSDIESLAPGQARYAGWCSAKGRLLASFLVVPFAGGFLLQLSRDLAPAVAKRLSMFVLRSKVKLTDVSGLWGQFGIWSPGIGGAALGRVKAKARWRCASMRTGLSFSRLKTATRRMLPPETGRLLKSAPAGRSSARPPRTSSCRRW